MTLSWPYVNKTHNYLFAEIYIFLSVKIKYVIKNDKIILNVYQGIISFIENKKRVIFLSTEQCFIFRGLVKLKEYKNTRKNSDWPDNTHPPPYFFFIFFSKHSETRKKHTITHKKPLDWPICLPYSLMIFLLSETIKPSTILNV